MMHDQNIIWPPQYTIKRHRRARSVKLRAIDIDSLQITVPYRFSLKYIPEVLEENKAWIIKQLNQLILKYPAKNALPEKIYFHSRNEEWSVNYLDCQTKFKIFIRPDQELAIVGPIKNKEACLIFLAEWIRDFAKECLLKEFNAISQHIQLPFYEAKVRDQKTIWGSCTVHKTISLNYKLIFLPLPLVHYVFIHELAHTIHLNHSLRFWKLVEKHDPLWRTHRAQLRKAELYLPAWV